MFDKEDAKEIRKDFWTGYGQQMGRYSSVCSKKQKWLNYRTGVRHLYFRLHADKKKAVVSIDIQHPDEGIRELYYDQWEEYQTLLHKLTGTEWNWERSYPNPSGGEMARIYVEKLDVNLYKPQDWATIWNWFKPLQLGFDELWADAIDIFQDLAK